MEWRIVPYIWKACIELAWESYLNYSVPVGAVIVNPAGRIISKGRNRMFDTNVKDGKLYGHPLAHAELDALLNVNVVNNPDVLDYTLYTTCEPCYLCFGAIMMSKIRKVEYAAGDKSGAVYLNKTDSKIRGKGMIVKGPVNELEACIIALQVCFDLEWNINNHSKNFPNKVLEGSQLRRYVNFRFREDSIGEKLGKNLFYNNILIKHKRNNSRISDVWNHLNKLCSYLKAERRSEYAEWEK